ncbi:MAG: hypothetical protein KC618_00590 [Candidatus Omnitrophica bacterium]|nr:hypothetical protein [Candidatus Omnitrophota bacterium]
MLRKRFKRLVLIGMLVSVGFTGIPDGSAEEKADQVQIYMGGKFYPSMEAYKQKQFEERLKQIVSLYEGERSEDILRYIHRDISNKYLNRMSEEKLLRIIDQARVVSQPKKLENENMSQYDEMQIMLKDYLKTKNSSEEITIDPAKVKTFIINPSTPKQGADN